MAIKTKKITINALKKATSEYWNKESLLEWNGLKIKINKTIGLGDMVLFYQNIINNCFEDDSLEYRPEIKDFAFRNNVVEYYTNLTLPSNLEKRYEMLYGTDLIDRIIENIDAAQINSIKEAVSEKIHYITNSNIKTVMKQMDELRASVEEAIESVHELVAGIDKDEIEKMLEAVSDGEFSGNKMMRAYLDKVYPDIIKDDSEETKE